MIRTASVLDRKQKLSIWVEGAYGTGKSHAVLTLKKLLDASDADTKEYFEKYELDNDLCNNLQRIKNSGKILTVHRYGSSSIHGDQDLVLAIQESIDHAFVTAGMENKGSDSLKDSVIRYLSDPENKQSFGIYVKGSYADLFGGDTVDDILHKLNTYSDLALHTLMEKIFKVAKERQSRKLVKSIARIDDDDLKDILPIHPYTALLLKHISSAFDSNQRSMFDFIKNDRGDEIKGFQWFIDNYGPEDDNPLLTIWCIKEFGPYQKYMKNDWSLYNSIISSVDDYPEEFLPLAIRELGSNTDFCQGVLTCNKQFPYGIAQFISKALELEMVKEAQVIFTATAMNPIAKGKDIEGVIYSIISDCSTWEELETMERFKFNLLPIIKM